MDTLTDFREYTESHGGLVATAESLGISKGKLWAWIARGQVPVEECHRVRATTGLELWSLRPADWHRIWPELIGTKGAPRAPRVKVPA